MTIDNVWQNGWHTYYTGTWTLDNSGQLLTKSLTSKLEGDMGPHAIAELRADVGRRVRYDVGVKGDKLRLKPYTSMAQASELTRVTP